MEHKEGNPEDNWVERFRRKAIPWNYITESFDDALTATPNVPQKKQFFVYIISPKKPKPTGSAAQKTEPLSLKILSLKQLIPILTTQKSK